MISNIIKLINDTIENTICIGLSNPFLNKGVAPENNNPTHIKNGRKVRVSGTIPNNTGITRNVLK
jgi:hypothetical protein